MKEILCQVTRYFFILNYLSRNSFNGNIFFFFIASLREREGKKEKILGWLKQQQIENEYRKLNIFLRLCLESQQFWQQAASLRMSECLKLIKKRVQNAKEKLIIIYFNLNLCAQWRLSLSSFLALFLLILPPPLLRDTHKLFIFRCLFRFWDE